MPQKQIWKSLFPNNYSFSVLAFFPFCSRILWKVQAVYGLTPRFHLSPLPSHLLFGVDDPQTGDLQLPLVGKLVDHRLGGEVARVADRQKGERDKVEEECQEEEVDEQESQNKHHFLDESGRN